jgi:starch synthase (maltosyl-transferring)
MGFNSLYINPFHAIGTSMSIYAIKDHYEYNPLFFSSLAQAEYELRYFLEVCRHRNLDIFMDLVINHTAIDSPLTWQHKDWYLLSKDGDIEKPKTLTDQGWITWEDLAKFDLDNSPDKSNLWQYLLEICRYYLKLGFTGFRCDAAYHVSSDFWSYLITAIKAEFTDALFLAETFVCPVDLIQALVSSEFDYIFNSSKWWNFNDDWCLKQYEITSAVVPSISFPETHDTPRLMAEVGGNETGFLQRLYFTAVFSKGFMIVTGFEYGFEKQISVITFKPGEWEDRGRNYSSKIKKILKIKKLLRPLHEESRIDIIEQGNKNVLCFTKKWDKSIVLIVMNKNVSDPQNVYLNDVETILKTNKVVDYSPEKRLYGYVKKLNLNLLPGELKIFANKTKSSETIQYNQ